MDRTDIFDAAFSGLPALPGAAAGEFQGLGGCCLRVRSGVDAAGFEAFAAALGACGFSALQRRELGGNRFAALQKGERRVNLLYTPCCGEMRVTAAEKEAAPCLQPAGCAGEGETVFYAFENDHTLIDCGMCLLVQCPDGSFFVVDGGHYFQPHDHDRLYEFMRGRTPAGKKVTVCGWLITHAHTDHVCVLMDFLRYNARDTVIEGFYHNILPPDYAVWGGDVEEAATVKKLLAALGAYPAPSYILHTGMRFYVRNLAFDVLSTHEDLHPAFIEDYNDSSVAVMLEAEGSRVFIPGDAAVRAGEKMEARWGSALKCDAVQVSHHGHTGLSPRCYERIGADTAIFPVTRVMFEQELPRQAANRRAIELAAQYFVTGDGTVCVPLPYRREAVSQLPDETTEDFAKIRRLWKYDYPEEYKAYIHETFLKNGGDPGKLLLPAVPGGYIEPK
jgi:beta-lactamase superfamily II metal-dependent hydrolase